MRTEEAAWPLQDRSTALCSLRYVMRRRCGLTLLKRPVAKDDAQSAVAMSSEAEPANSTSSRTLQCRHEKNVSSSEHSRIGIEE